LKPISILSRSGSRDFREQFHSILNAVLSTNNSNTII
jgi:hypothetical protein